MLSTRFTCSLVVIFVHISSQRTVFLFKLLWRGPPCNDPNITYRLKQWHDSHQQIQFCDDADLLLIVCCFYSTEVKLHPISLFSREKQDSHTKQQWSRMALLKLWGKPDFYNCFAPSLQWAFSFFKYNLHKYQGIHDTRFAITKHLLELQSVTAVLSIQLRGTGKLERLKHAGL